MAEGSLESRVYALEVQIAEILKTIQRLEGNIDRCFSNFQQIEDALRNIGN